MSDSLPRFPASRQSVRGFAPGEQRPPPPAGGCCLVGGPARAKMTTRCLWNACKALSLGLVLLALGCAMATLGYYADQLSEWRQAEGNSTLSIKDDWAGFHLNNLSYAGPIVMGVGGFIVVAACVMTFEARDSAAKVVPARFRLQRTRSPMRSRKGPQGTPAAILPHGAPGSRRSAASQTGDLSQPKRPTPAPGVHRNHQQILELLARRRREERSFTRRQPGALVRTPSAPSALNRLHHRPPPPREPPLDSHVVEKRSLKHSPLGAGRRPQLRRQAMSVDTDAGRTTKALCHESYSPLLAPRAPGSVEVVMEPLGLAAADVDAVRPYPESPPRRMLSERSETARRHLLMRQEKINCG
ncbi:uncharacterized protein LOC124164401 [Ischnura elegans]|uniref:uncharacterized protein LOC124164401 n=1 Tax=Ischnura elegans TaxID=197161 RepID=UPI001ED87F66|nr:uncharacterized protein LOC124164401 [Ischnura elegans]